MSEEDRAQTWAQLRKMKTPELIRRHDEIAGKTSVGLNYYLDEIRRRETALLTRAVFLLSIIATVAALASAVLAYLVYQRP